MGVDHVGVDLVKVDLVCVNPIFLILCSDHALVKRR